MTLSKGDGLHGSHLIRHRNLKEQRMQDYQTCEREATQEARRLEQEIALTASREEQRIALTARREELELELSSRAIETKSNEKIALAQLEAIALQQANMMKLLMQVVSGKKKEDENKEDEK